MIQTDNTNKGSIKEIRERERKEQETKLRQQCQELAYERFGEEQVIKWGNQYKGLWYLPVMDESDENIEVIALMKPINRHILSYASTKISDEGLYAFLEQCMRECFIAGDNSILDDDDYFIPAAMKFNAILEGKKAALLKR
ncbi:hypothetical protein A4H97_32130 [Niastella yeongjuensis]|uniref:Uncharacterized protein n=1 Tax=Niastella yeongjuensis TaxID=354355 RepID=A0A1V9EIK6_9BACT|nr:hypothetical protein [Niastella yeongjuensis]OQP45891.1 hypothetical protein A4H97_32130 [Niastella yeongjuensis]SEP46799.1 hypothetical protein SAMN05660816_06508 [Niastella yeongjuensis]